MSRFFFFNDTATTEIYTLSLHDALPICDFQYLNDLHDAGHAPWKTWERARDRKSTRLNSSHQIISYAVFCLKKKNIQQTIRARLVGAMGNVLDQRRQITPAYKTAREKRH